MIMMMIKGRSRSAQHFSHIIISTTIRVFHKNTFFSWNSYCTKLIHRYTKYGVMRPKLWLKPILRLFLRDQLFWHRHKTRPLKKQTSQNWNITLCHHLIMHHYHRHGDDNGVDDLDSTDSETESRLLVMREIFVHCGGAVVYNELGGHSQSHIKTFPLYR